MSERPAGAVNMLVIGGVATLVTMFGPIAVDLYLPGLPAMATALAADEAALKQTLSVYILGFGVSQVVYGPLSDAFGRRPVLLVACAIFAAASIACALATTVEQLIAFRFVQALGAAGGQVVARAVVRDFHAGAAAARMLGHMASAMALAPVLAPIAGGVIVTLFDWRANFWTLTGFGVAALLAVALALPESNPFREPRAARPAAMVVGFGRLLSHRGYRGYLLCAVFMFNGLFAFLTNASFVLIDEMGLSALEFGIAFGGASLAFLVAAQIGVRLVGRLGIDRMVRAGTAIAAFAGVWFLAVLSADLVTPATVMIGTVAYFAAMGITVPSLQAGAVSPFPRNAGAASSLLGLSQYAVGGAVALLAELIALDASLKLAVLMGISGPAAFLAFVVIVGNRRSDATPDD